VSATLALKIVLVPALIALITLAGRRWGQGFAGWLGSFPIVAGPVLLVVTLENGNLFGAQAAQAALAGVTPSMVFYVVYTRLAPHASWPWVAFAGLAAWTLVAAALLHFAWPLWATVTVTALALYVAPRLMPKPDAVQGRAAHPFELPARMFTGAAVTVLSSELGRLGGASLSGFAALFPSIGLIVATFNHAQSSASAATAFLRGMTRGMWSVAAFCLVLSTMLGRGSLAMALTVAVGAALLTHAAFKPRSHALPMGRPG
jgi:uncharacterized membrane protein (GlpM family)